MLPADLERSTRKQLQTLGRVNADKVSRHLVMVQRLLDEDPQAAYEHARYAAYCAGRVAAVREAAAVAAYLAGSYADALREVRAARRLSGRDVHRAIEADCERALGHHDRALRVAAAADAEQLDDVERAELAMVVSGVRHELGQTALGLVVIEDAIRSRPGSSEILRRLHLVRADRLEELGRTAEAEAVRRRVGLDPDGYPDDAVEVFDMTDEYPAVREDGGSGSEADSASVDEAPDASRDAGRPGLEHGGYEDLDRDAGDDTAPGRSHAAFEQEPGAVLLGTSASTTGGEVEQDGGGHSV